MERYPEYTAHGYAVSMERVDCGVYLEGVNKGAPADSVGELEDFTTLFKNADEVDTASMYSWFD